MLSRRVIAVLLAALLVLGVAACGSSDDDEGSAGGGGASSGASSDRLIPLPEIDKSNGLTIAGEQVADKELYDAAMKEGEVIVYSSASQETEDIANARFTEETGIKVNFTRLPGSKLSERVLSEAGANQLSAQVIRISDPEAGIEFAEEKIFSAYETPFHAELAAAEKDVISKDGSYLRPFYSAFIMAYNSELVSGEAIPKSWKDLADPQWKGKIGMTNAGAGGTTTALADFHIHEIGEKYLQDLGELDPRIFDTTSVQLEAMSRGEIEVSPSAATSGYSVIVQGAPLGLAVPSDGVVATPYSMGLTEAGADSAAAKVFTNWTMSKAGQAFAASQGYIPGREGLPPQKTGDIQLPPADSPNVFIYEPEEHAEHSDASIKTWNDAMGYLG